MVCYIDYEDESKDTDSLGIPMGPPVVFNNPNEVVLGQGEAPNLGLDEHVDVEMT